MSEDNPPPPSSSSAEDTPLILKPFTKAAAGLGAVVSAMQHGMREMGGIRSVKTLCRVNQVEGFDCPGCAWPDPEHRAHAEFCENGAKAVASEATKKRILPEFFKQWSIEQLNAQSEYWMDQQGRLTHPMIRHETSTHYEPIAWDDAFALIAKELKALDTPNEALFYTSGRTSNEAAFLYQLFAREYGTNNLPDCSNMCHESSGHALSSTIGIGKGTVSLQDFEHADMIMVIGQNPGTNHPRMMTALHDAAKRGCKIVSINPLKEASLVRFSHPQKLEAWVGAATDISTTYLQVKINGDSALLKGLAKVLLELEKGTPGTVLDRDFINTHCSGYDEFIQTLQDITWDEIEEASGISHMQIEILAAEYAKSERVIACWAMGLTQHKNSVATIQDLVNLLLLRGNLGRQGAGVCPVRGHSNVQGDRTMGIWERPGKAFLDAIETSFGFSPPREHGYDVVHAIRAMHAGDAKVLFCMGGNFLSASPDTNFTAEALQRCQLTVQVSTKLNRSHLITGKQALILPCLGRTEMDTQKTGEQFVTVENSMRVVTPSRGRLQPASEHLMSEPGIVAAMAQATLGDSSVIDWAEMTANYDHIRDAIEKTIPGFEHYNERIKTDRSFVLPNAASERVFHTSDGKAQFNANPLETIRLQDDQFLLMTMRSHDQYNTTIYGLKDRYRGIYNERRVILMHPDNIKDAGMKAKQAVDVTSHFQDRQLIAKGFFLVPYDIPRRCLAAYFPEANELIPVDSYADGSHTPTSKSVIVTLRPMKT